MYLQEGDFFPVIAPIRQTALIGLGISFISSLFKSKTSNISKFFKKVLKQAEVDCLRQKQLNDYSTELHTLVRLQDKLIEILSRKDISADK